MRKNLVNGVTFTARYGFSRTACLIIGFLLFVSTSVGAETNDAATAEVVTTNTVTPEIEVMHWWYRSGEARAMRVLRDEFESRGGKWRDVSGLNSEVVLNRAVSRMAKGYAPTLVQWNSAWEIDQIRRLGLLNNAEPKMNAALQASLIDNIVDMITVDGEIVAVPTSVHSENWLWYLTDHKQSLFAEALTDWVSLLSKGEQLKNASTPISLLAVGNEPWQQRLLFNNVLLGVSGAKQYERLYQQLDISVIGEKHFRETARIFQQLSRYSQSFGEGRWDQQVAAVAGGKASAVVLADFAKGEFKNLGLRNGLDFECVPAPGTENHILLAMDFFVFGQVQSESEKLGQELFIEVVTDSLTNETFNYLKGSLPPLKNIDEYSFDRCNRIAYSTLNKKGSALLPYASAGDRGFITEIDHAISRLWSTDIHVDDWLEYFESIFTKESEKRNLFEFSSLED